VAPPFLFDRPPFRIWSRLTNALLAATVAAGCAAYRPGPVDTLGAYSAALRDARYADAYNLLSADTRRAMPYGDFERLAREHPEEVRETLRWLDRVDPSAPITATMELPNGESLLLVQENGQWRLDPSVLDFYGQHTPRQALRSFVRALERRRYDVLMRFVPSRLAHDLDAQRLREAWETGADAENVRDMLRRLRESTDRPIEIVGNRATMTYGAGGQYVMQFVREDSAWRIEDPE